MVLIGISNDSPDELASWLKDEDFPFVFASDAANHGETYTKFGGSLRDNGFVESRSVFVVGPDGRIAGVIPQFRQMDPQAYEELGEIVDRVTPEPEGGI